MCKGWFFLVLLVCGVCGMGGIFVVFRGKVEVVCVYLCV